jgi:plastocyanin
MTAFSPAALPVSVGATVVFALGFDGIGHDVQFAAAAGSPAYIPVTVRSYVRVSFPTAGTFNYTCPTHPQMTGTITVQ